MPQPNWNIYLSGEIHSDWRQRIEQGISQAGLPVTLLAPVTDHATSGLRLTEESV